MLCDRRWLHLFAVFGSLAMTAVTLPRRDIRSSFPTTVSRGAAPSRRPTCLATSARVGCRATYRRGAWSNLRLVWDGLGAWFRRTPEALLPAPVPPRSSARSDRRRPGPNPGIHNRGRAVWLSPGYATAVEVFPEVWPLPPGPRRCRVLVPSFGNWRLWAFWHPRSGHPSGTRSCPSPHPAPHRSPVGPWEPAAVVRGWAPERSPP